MVAVVSFHALHRRFRCVRVLVDEIGSRREVGGYPGHQIGLVVLLDASALLRVRGDPPRVQRLPADGHPAPPELHTSCPTFFNVINFVLGRTYTERAVFRKIKLTRLLLLFLRTPTTTNSCVRLGAAVDVSTGGAPTGGLSLPALAARRVVIPIQDINVAGEATLRIAAPAPIPEGAHAALQDPRSYQRLARRHAFLSCRNLCFPILLAGFGYEAAGLVDAGDRISLARALRRGRSFWYGRNGRYNFWSWWR